MLPCKIWDFWASRYESLLVQTLVLTPIRKAALIEIKGYLGKRDMDEDIRILDMGCGTGQSVCEMESALNGYNPRITGVDLSAGMLGQAMKKKSAAEFVCADAERYMPGAHFYDVIVCLNSFPYYRNQEKVLANFFRMLKKEGLLIMAHASINSFYDRLVMLSVKATVSRSRYVSISEMCRLSQQVSGKIPEYTRVPVKCFIPSICMFAWR